MQLLHRERVTVLAIVSVTFAEQDLRGTEIGFFARSLRLRGARLRRRTELGKAARAEAKSCSCQTA